MDDNECEVEFRFKKADIYTLSEIFRLPEVIRCYNGTLIDSVEALCVCLKRYAYPFRYADTSQDLADLFLNCVWLLIMLQIISLQGLIIF